MWATASGPTTTKPPGTSLARRPGPPSGRRGGQEREPPHRRRAGAPTAPSPTGRRHPSDRPRPMAGRPRRGHLRHAAMDAGHRTAEGPTCASPWGADALYAVLLDAAPSRRFSLPGLEVDDLRYVRPLGEAAPLDWTVGRAEVSITLSERRPAGTATVVRLAPAGEHRVPCRSHRRRRSHGGSSACKVGPSPQTPVTH